MVEQSHSRPAGLGDEFTELADLLTSTTGQGLDLDRLVRFVAASVPVESHCAITLLRPDRSPRTLASTDELSRQVDILQYETDEGPCLDAARGEDPAPVADLLTDKRWPVFGPRCVQETGIRSMLAVRLSVAGGDHAALNLSSRTPSAFDELATSLAAIYAPFATLAVEQALRSEDTEHLSAALSSSRQIGTAVGIIMARELVTAEEAMEILRRSSQHLNRKLRDIATDVTDTGQLPVA